MDRFEPLSAAAQRDLDAGIRTTRPFVRDAGLLKADITERQFFILGGQIAYVADVGKTFRAPNGETDARLRVVYSNGTESNLLRRSLQRALYKDDAGRRITEPTAGPLFADDNGDDDQASGTIYVLRSKSDHPLVVANREVLHKIGVTGGDLRAGDTLVVWKLDRLGRTVRQLVTFIEDLQATASRFVRSPMDRHDHARGPLLLSRHGRAGGDGTGFIAGAHESWPRRGKARGRKGGRPPKLSNEQIAHAERPMTDPKVSHASIARSLSVDRSTLYRMLA